MDAIQDLNAFDLVKAQENSTKTEISMFIWVAKVPSIKILTLKQLNNFKYTFIFVRNDTMKS